MTRLQQPLSAVMAICLLVGCDGEGPTDGGATDAAPADAATADAGSQDGGGADAGQPGEDASIDAGAGDDAGTADGGSDAGGAPDAGPADGGIDPSSIPAPRPIEPASTALTTTPTVRFRWALAAPATGARVEICRDRACIDVREVIDVEGESTSALVPPDPGSTSRVFYFRLTGRADGVLGTARSPVWSFAIHGRLSVPVSSTWGTTYDFDGDGLSDLLGGAPASSAVRLYRGRSPIGAAPAADTTFSATPTTALGSVVVGVGDVDGDGLADLALGTATSVLVYHGVLGGFPASVPVTAARTVISGVSPSRATLAAAGDVDRDGYADIVIADPDMSRILLHRGGASGVEETGAPLVGADAGFGASVAGGCDVNGDGYSDVIVGATGGAIVLFGGATGLDVENSQALTPGPSSSGFGSSVACAGDVNGDGYADVIVGAPLDNAAFVYHGASSGISTLANGALRKVPGIVAGASTRHADAFGSVVAAAGDVNGDGFGDVVVTAPEIFDGNDGFVGYAFVFHAGMSGLPMTPPGSSTVHNRAIGSTPVENRTVVAQRAGDVDGDGIDDLVSGAPFRGAGGAGAVLLNLGDPSVGILNVPAWLIDGGVLSGFGTTIASWWTLSSASPG